MLIAPDVIDIEKAPNQLEPVQPHASSPLVLQSYGSRWLG